MKASTLWHFWERATCAGQSWVSGLLLARCAPQVLQVLFSQDASHWAPQELGGTCSQCLSTSPEPELQPQKPGWRVPRASAPPGDLLCTPTCSLLAPGPQQAGVCSASGDGHTGAGVN